MAKFTRDWIKGVLTAEPETVVLFTKKDGTERRMRCTLMEAMLPLREKDTIERAENPDVLPVWDLDKDAWRSFRVDSVTNVIY